MHRIVFQRDLGGREVTLFANCEIDGDVLEELEAFVAHQRNRRAEREEWARSNNHYD